MNEKRILQLRDNLKSVLDIMIPVGYTLEHMFVGYGYLHTADKMGWYVRITIRTLEKPLIGFGDYAVDEDQAILIVKRWIEKIYPIEK